MNIFTLPGHLCDECGSRFPEILRLKHGADDAQYCKVCITRALALFSKPKSDSVKTVGLKASDP